MSLRPTRPSRGAARLARVKPSVSADSAPAAGVDASRGPSAGSARTIVVGIADCKLTEDPSQILLTYALGSCVGVAIWNRKTHAAALLHAMLPDSSLDSGRAKQNPDVFVDSGLSRVIARMSSAAGSSEDLVVKLAGGASLLDSSRRFQVGVKNIEAARRIIVENGLIIGGEDTGGNGSRTMVLEVMTGRVSLRRGTEEIGSL